MADLKRVINEGISVGEKARSVLAALESPAYDWRTIGGISEETGLSGDAVREILLGELSNVVIQSTVPDQKGRALYTTRERYLHRHGGLERLRNIFKAG